MAIRRAYLDHNATSPLRPSARAALVAALDEVGNPSSVHAEGRAARKLVEDARATLARGFGVKPSAVTFTSGGSEAAATLLSPAFGRDRKTTGPATTLMVSAIEHPCVLTGGRFTPDRVVTLPVRPTGILDLDALDHALRAASGPVVVAVMAANNETGVLQPIAALAERVAATPGAALIVDAVQVVGRQPVAIGETGVDAMFLSAHKLGGPKGIGAIIRRDAAVAFDPLVLGGGQESRQRAGTEAVALIAAFAAAFEDAIRDVTAEAARLTALRDAFEADLRARVPQAVFIGDTAERLPNTSLVAVPGLKSETAVIGLDLAGVAVSSGSACSSGKVARSHVLAAMGVDPTLADAAVRVSFGWSSDLDDVIQTVTAFEKVIGHLKKGRVAA